jgi:mRNA interferase MazF
LITVRRGSIWWLDLEPMRDAEIRKSGPMVVLSADDLNRVRRTAVVVPLSTGPVARPSLVVRMRSMGHGAVAVCNQLRAVDRTRLRRAAGFLSREDMQVVEESVRAVPAL